MSQIAQKHLLAGIIFGDAETGEYIYLPGGEVGTDRPLCVFEHDGQKRMSTSNKPATSSIT
jgi:hypothetical protein